MAYLGTQPNNVKQNTGLYTLSEILQLTKDGSWGGSLELIESQTVSSASAVDFTSIKGNVYDVHILQLINGHCADDNKAFTTQLSNDGGSSFETSNYQWAFSYQKSNGTFQEKKSTSDSAISLIHNIGNSTGEQVSGYIYYYNLNNSSKFSFTTHQFTGMTQDPDYISTFGGGVYAVAETINAIRLLITSSTFASATVNLYGVKQI
tara:strand:- start:10241 stop:10858 length:618 start_codon:yes stop_codon:yes gene_type:complete